MSNYYNNQLIVTLATTYSKLIANFLITSLEHKNTKIKTKEVFPIEV